jgi:hypothetical protein
MKPTMYCRLRSSLASAHHFMLYRVKENWKEYVALQNTRLVAPTHPIEQK